MTTEHAVEQPTDTTVAPLPSQDSNSTNVREQWELVVLLVIAIIGAGAALAGAPVVLRLIFGLPLVVFIPGYALTTTLFPSGEALDGLERMALGFGLSFAIIPLMALGIEFSPWKLTLTPIACCLLAATVALTLAAIWRRNRLPKDLRFVAEIPRPAPPPISTWSRTSKIGAAIIVAALLIFGSSSAALVAQRLRPNPSTEFALFNQNGQAAYYARTFAPGQAQQVQLEIENHEGKDVTYVLDVVAGATTVGSIGSIPIADGETWQRPVTIQLPPALTETGPGEPLALEFNLYRDTPTPGEAPYRSLRLFIDVNDQSMIP